MLSTRTITCHIDVGSRVRVCGISVLCTTVGLVILNTSRVAGAPVVVCGVVCGAGRLVGVGRVWTIGPCVSALRSIRTALLVTASLTRRHSVRRRGTIAHVLVHLARLHRGRDGVAVSQRTYVPTSGGARLDVANTRAEPTRAGLLRVVLVCQASVREVDDVLVYATLTALADSPSRECND